MRSFSFLPSPLHYFSFFTFTFTLFFFFHIKYYLNFSHI